MMAMRLRTINGELRALCAAKFAAQDGDIYLDDSQDHAIRTKIYADYVHEGLIKGTYCAKDAGDISSCDEGCAINGCADYVDGKEDYEPSR